MAKFKEGIKYGKWTTIKTEQVTIPCGKKQTKWVVLCECGTLSKVSSRDIQKGKTTQCIACYGRVKKDLTSQRFSHWVVLSESASRMNRAYWNCVCDCGSKHEVCQQTLLNGTSTKCTECNFKQSNSIDRSSHPLYSIWHAMISRCENKNGIGWKNYGGRGIKVCERWHCLHNFFDKHSIDRIDVNGDYTPENCRWATSIEQHSNKRNNHFIFHDSKKYTLSEMARILNIQVSTLCRYISANPKKDAVHHFKNSKYNYKPYKSWV